MLLSQGRKRREFGVLADIFFDDLRIAEHEIIRPGALDELLDGHNGEVWLTGPYEMHVYDPDVHIEFPWISTRRPTLR